MEVLRDVGLPRKWPAGRALFRQGEPADTVVVVTAGRVRLSHVEASGRAHTIEDSGPGAVLGEFDVIRNTGYGLTVVALEATDGVAVSRMRFRETLLKHPAYAVELLERALRGSVAGGSTEKEEQLRAFEEEQVRFDVFRSALANGDEAIVRLHFARHPSDLPTFLSLLEVSPSDAVLLGRLERMIDDGLLAESEIRRTARKQPVL
jgi:CRP-like cAMP-binding protein